MSELMTVNENQVAVPDNSSSDMAMMIMNMASNADFDVEKLEKLMDLQEREMARRAQVAFNRDFAAMQSDITSVSKGSKVSYPNAKGGKTEYTFATLEDIVDVVRPVLHQHGFAISFKVNTSSGVNVQCSLMHKDGHSIETAMQLQSDKSGGKNDVQALGSSISYAKRYTLSSLLNIATRDDDDAQTAMQKDSRFITAGQSKTLESKLDSLSDKKQGAFNNWLNEKYTIESVSEVKVSQFNTVLSAINKLAAKKELETA